MKALRRICAIVLIILFSTIGLCYGQNIINPSFVINVSHPSVFKGVEFAAQGIFKEAKEKFESALEGPSPDELAKEYLRILKDVTDKKIESKAVIHFFRGTNYIFKWQTGETIAELNKAIEINPRFVDAYSLRGIVLSSIGAYDHAIDDFNKVLEINPRDAVAYSFRGLTKSILGKLHEGLEDFNKALEINPRLAGAYTRRGFAYVTLGKLHKAMEDFNQAISLDPNDALTYNNRGFVWEKRGNYDHAIDDYNKALKINQRLAMAYSNRGRLWAKKGDYDRAIDDYNKALKINPRDAKTYYNRGVSWAKKKDYDRVIEDCTKALEINPRLAGAYTARGFAWIRKGNYDPAIADCTKAMKIDPSFVKAYFNRGNAWERKGDYNRAITDYTKIIEINPRWAGGYLARGMLWLKEGDYDRVCSDLQKACELGVCIGLNLAKEKGHCRHKGFDKTEIPERPLRHVVDLAGIVDDATENRMNGYLQELEQKTTVQLVILTIKSLEGESIEDFSIKVARDKWKLGQKGKDNGVLLLISLEDQKYRIEVGYGLEGVFPGSLLDSMGRNLLVPYFRKGDYSTGIFNTTLAIANEIATDSGMKIEGMPKIKHRIRSEE